MVFKIRELLYILAGEKSRHICAASLIYGISERQKEGAG